MSKPENREAAPSRALRHLPALARWHGFLLLLAAAFLAYAPALPGEPVWDDTFLVGSNPFFRSPLFSLEIFRHWLFPDSLSVYYRPLQNLSYTLDYIIWQGSPFGYHLTNILIHGGVAVLLFLVLEKLISRIAPQVEGSNRTARWLALGVSIVWIVHPVHNAAVAYIAGRADSLAALFALGGWLLFLQAADCRGARRFSYLSGAWVAGLLAFCSKEIAFTWLALFVCVEFIPRFRGGSGTLPLRRIGRSLAAIIGMIGVYCLLRHLPDARHAPATVATAIPERLMLMARALGDYTGLIFYPADLRMCRLVWTPAAYATTQAWQQHIGYEYLSLLGMATLAAFVLGCRGTGTGSALRRMGVLWFLTGFLPISNLIPLNAQVAEHWIYMPSIGYLLFLAGCGSALPARWRLGGLIIVVVAVAGFTLRTRARCDDWTSPERFYSATVGSGSGDPRILTNIANTYVESGKLGDAEKLLRATIASRPDFLPARIQLGHVLIGLKRATEAEAILREAGETGNPHAYAHSWTAQIGLAQIQLNQGRTKDALAVVDAALAGNPGATDLIRTKLLLLERSGRVEEGLALAEHYCRTGWWDTATHSAWVRLLLNAGKPDAALAVLRHMARLDIWNSDPLTLSARIELSRGRPEAALPLAKSAVWRNGTPSNYLILAGICRQLHRDTEAVDAVRRAEELRREQSTAAP